MQERNTRQGTKFAYLNPCEAGRKILVLWDIDGTLMHCGSNGTKALNQAFEELFGISNAMTGAGIGSAMDWAILERITKHFGIDESEKPRIIQTFVEKLKVVLDENMTKRVLPGIRELLDYTKDTDYIHAVLLTSNFKAGAEVKLKSVGLWDYFEIGGFGDQEGEKWHAAEVAVKEVEDRYDCCFDRNDIYVMGDSKYDIDCAKKLGYKSIAVATGWMEKDELQSHAPDYLFDDLGAYETIIGIWKGEKKC